MAQTTNNPKITTADHIRATRLWMHRKLDEMLDQICEPGFHGGLFLELPSVDGRPMHPVTYVKQCGIHELKGRKSP